MKYRVFSDVLGAVLAAASLSACSDHNTSDYEETTTAPTEETISETEVTTEAETTEPVTNNDKKKNSSAHKNSPSEEAVLNRQTILFTMDNGDYVYSAFVNETDGLKEVYVRDSRKGKAEELKLPESSLVMYSDGEKLYYYSPNEGLCEYDDGKSSLISKETKSEDEIPLRESFYFTEDTIYFAVSNDDGTEIKSVDYSGKLSDEVYTTEHRNAKIVGTYDDKLVCSYSIGTNEYICIFDGKKAPTEQKIGRYPFISGDMLYYTELNKLSCMPLDGGEAETVVDEKCTDYCFYNGKLIYTDGTAVFEADGKGSGSPLLDAKDLNKCDYISNISVSGGKLFVCGGSGAYWKCISETDEDGKVAEEIYAGVER